MSSLFKKEHGKTRLPGEPSLQTRPLPSQHAAPRGRPAHRWRQLRPAGLSRGLAGQSGSPSDLPPNSAPK